MEHQDPIITALHREIAEPNRKAGFTDKIFKAGSDSVDATGSSITSTGTSTRGFFGRFEADITIASSSPFAIRIDHLRINE
jgi:hypothetical protein